jgi:hypothetical protein
VNRRGFLGSLLTIAGVAAAPKQLTAVAGIRPASAPLKSRIITRLTPLYATTMASFDAALKRRYSDRQVGELAMREHPLLKLRPR